METPWLAVSSPYLVWAHGHSQVEQAPRLHEAGNPAHIPDVTPRVHRITVPAQPIVLVAREGHRKIELGQVAAEPGLSQPFGREGADCMML